MKEFYAGGIRTAYVRLIEFSVSKSPLYKPATREDLHIMIILGNISI